MKSWLGFDLHFHYGQVCWVFLHFLAIWTSSVEKSLFSFLPISSLGHCFFGSWTLWALCVFWLSIPCHRYY
jgi:hypothetical protein